MLTSIDGDPDQYSFVGFWCAFLVETPLTLLNYLNPVALWRDCHRFRMARGEIVVTVTLFAVYAAVIPGTRAMGYWLEFVVLWLLPWFFGNLVMLTMFCWMLHKVDGRWGVMPIRASRSFPVAISCLCGRTCIWCITCCRWCRLDPLYRNAGSSRLRSLRKWSASTTVFAQALGGF